MNLQEAINDPRINVFDIIKCNGKINIKTYRKPNESAYDYNIRHDKNVEKAEELTKNKAR
jgi:hypothetical protein